MALSHDEKVAKAKQAVAKAAAKLARLQKATRGEDTAQKVLVGALVLRFARDARQAATRKWLIEQISNVTREHDKKRLEPLVAELRAIQSPVVGVQQQEATKAANL